VDAAPPRLALRWAALLHDVEKPATKHVTKNKVTFYNHEVLGARTAALVLGRLRYGRDIIEHVTILIQSHLFNTDMGDKGLRRLIRRVTPDRMPDLFDLRRADVKGMGMGGQTNDVDEFEVRFQAEIDAKAPLNRSDLVIDGHELMNELKIAPGKELGEVIDYLLERVLDEPENNERSVLVDLARKYLDRGAVLAASAIFGTLTCMGG
jgi:putative nucleotidyltransferase with HDIG domain